MEIASFALLLGTIIVNVRQQFSNIISLAWLYRLIDELLDRPVFIIMTKVNYGVIEGAVSRHLSGTLVGCKSFKINGNKN